MSNKKNTDDNVFAHNPIQWYPGHMAKARREIAEAIKLVDIVVEIIDARIPISSRNPVLNEIIGDKPRIIVLNKADLADNTQNQKWVQNFKNNNQIAIITDSNKGKGIKEVTDAAYSLMKEKIDKQIEKGRTGASIKLMIVGIPNVGKSTFINKIAGKQSADVGNKPGVTKKNQWVEKTARHLAYIGTIKDTIIDIEELALNLIEELLENYKENLYSRYKIANDFEYEMSYEVMDEIGRKRGCLVKGGQVDYTKVANIVLYEFRTGKLGNITLEEVK